MTERRVEYRGPLEDYCYLCLEATDWAPIPDRRSHRPYIVRRDGRWVHWRHGDFDHDPVPLRLAPTCEVHGDLEPGSLVGVDDDAEYPTLCPRCRREVLVSFVAGEP